ncbi:MAG: MFS transporter [Armatimonadota bacterium]|nr:MFS transporter [Armatimonadota bacterium]MDR7534904.1 MFS transporter [Armatimonadota bacterium]
MLRGAFARLWAVVLLVSFAFHLVTASLPFYATRLGADEAVVGLLIGLIAAVALISRPLAGLWIDAGAGAAALVTGLVLYALCALGYWLAPSVPALLGFRALTGVAVGFYGTASQALTVALVPVARRAEALSLYAAAVGIAQGLAPSAGIALAAAAGFPALFVTCAGVSTAGAVLAWPLRRVSARPQAGAVRRIFHRGVVVPGLLLVALHVTFGANIALLPLHAGRRGLPNPGLVLVTHALGLFAAQAIAGRASDRLGRIAVIAPALALAAAGMWTTALVGGWALLAAAALSGMALGAGQPSIVALGADLVREEERGAALGTMGIFHEIGIVAGAVGGGIAGRALGLPAMFALVGVVPAVAAVLAVRRPAPGSSSPRAPAASGP